MSDISDSEKEFISNQAKNYADSHYCPESDDHARVVQAFKVAMHNGIAYGRTKFNEKIASAKDDALEELWKELNRWKPTLHFCRDWDFLLIENGDPEISACGCGPFPLKYKRDLPG